MINDQYRVTKKVSSSKNQLPSMTCRLQKLGPNLWGEGLGIRGNIDSENLDNLSRLRRESDTQGAELRIENRLLLAPNPLPKNL
jgi:hypothetical protein